MTVLKLVRSRQEEVERRRAEDERLKAEQQQAQARRQAQEDIIERFKDGVLNAMEPDQRPAFVSMIGALKRGVPLLRPAQINGTFVALAIEGPPKRGFLASFTTKKMASDPGQLDWSWRRAGLPMSEAEFLEFLVAQGFPADRAAVALRKSMSVPHVDTYLSQGQFKSLVDLAEYALRNLGPDQVDEIVHFVRSTGADA